jgi:hypothetical protein
MVIAALGGLLLRSLIAEQRQSERRRHQHQAMWIAESAVQRALSRRAASPDYTGESWQLTPEQLGGNRSGSARIQVQPVDPDGSQLRILVEADYPTDPVLRVRQRREILVPTPPQGDI